MLALEPSLVCLALADELDTALATIEAAACKSLDGS
jgi:hypothetical protein